MEYCVFKWKKIIGNQFQFVKYAHLISHMKITLACKHIIYAITCVYGKTIILQKFSWLPSPLFQNFKSFNQCQWEPCISNHLLFPIIKYLPFDPTRGLHTCKPSYAGESLSIDRKIIILKSVKDLEGPTPQGLNQEMFLSAEKYFKFILQVFMSPSESWIIELTLITAWDNT